MAGCYVISATWDSGCSKKPTRETAAVDGSVVPSARRIAPRPPRTTPKAASAAPQLVRIQEGEGGSGRDSQVGRFRYLAPGDTVWLGSSILGSPYLYQGGRTLLFKDGSHRQWINGRPVGINVSNLEEDEKHEIRKTTRDAGRAAVTLLKLAYLRALVELKKHRSTIHFLVLNAPPPPNLERAFLDALASLAAPRLVLSIYRESEPLMAAFLDRLVARVGPRIHGLELSSKKFTPVLLARLHALKRLRVLQVTGMALSKADVIGIADIQSLRELTLSSCKVSDKDLHPLSRAIRLRSIKFLGFSFQGSGLASLAKLPELRSLSLVGGRRDSAQILREVAKLKQLRRFDWDMLTTDGFKKFLKPLVKLQSLFIDRGRHDAEAWRQVAGLKDLRILTFGVDSGVGPKPLAAMTSLKKLRALYLLVSGSTSAVEGHLGAMTALEALVVPGVRFASIKKLTKLRWLFIGHLGDEGLQHLSGLKRLERLQVGRYFGENRGRRITGKGLAYLAGLKRLRWLSLPFGQITDNALKRFPTLPGLRRLDLKSNHLKGATLGELCRSPGLEIVQLHENRIEGRHLSQLATCLRLRRLELNKTPLNDLSGLARLRQVRTLDLSETNFRGKQYAHLAGMTQLRELRLVGAFFDFDAAKALSRLTQLKTLQVGALSDAGLPPYVQKPLRRALPNLRIRCPFACH